MEKYPTIEDIEVSAKYTTEIIELFHTIKSDFYKIKSNLVPGQSGGMESEAVEDAKLSLMEDYVPYEYVNAAHDKQWKSLECVCIHSMSAFQVQD